MEEPASPPVSPPLLSARKDIRQGAATAENVPTEHLVCPLVAQLVARWQTGRDALWYRDLLFSSYLDQLLANPETN